MLFSGSLEDLTISDIEAFCNQWSEGARVEFGGSISKDISKAVAAMANTMGGILLLGVTEDNNGNAIFPLVGMAVEKGIEDRIIQACVTGIYPPLVPELRVVKFDKDRDKCIVVVRVEESSFAPHAIQNKTRIYIRTGSQSNPVEYADLERIEFMLHRREKSENLRDSLLRRSRLRAEQVMNLSSTTPYLEFAIVPVYPSRPFFLPSIESMRKFGTLFETKVAGGFYKKRFNWEKNQGEYFELDQYGQFVEIFLQKGQMRIGEKWFEGPSFKHIVIRCREFLQDAAYIFRTLEYQGSLKFSLKIALQDPSSQTLIPLSEPIHAELEDFKSIDREITHDEIISITELEQTSRRVVTKNALSSIAWSFNVPEQVFEYEFEQCYGK